MTKEKSGPLNQIRKWPELSCLPTPNPRLFWLFMEWLKKMLELIGVGLISKDRQLDIEKLPSMSLVSFYTGFSHLDDNMEPHCQLLDLKAFWLFKVYRRLWCLLRAFLIFTAIILRTMILIVEVTACLKIR